jgi:hypothetical protein
MILQICKMSIPTTVYFRLHKIKSVSLYNLSDFVICLIVRSLKYKVVHIEILHVCSIHHWLSLNFYF